MKCVIENLIKDTEIKEVLYILEDVSVSKITKEEGLKKIENVRVHQMQHDLNNPHEIIYTLINDYKNEILDIQTLKEEIFSLLEEFKMLKRAH